MYSIFFGRNKLRLKKDNVLTKAIKYYPIDELLVTSLIYFDFCLRNLLFERKSQLISLKKIKGCKLRSFIKKCLLSKILFLELP